MEEYAGKIEMILKDNCDEEIIKIEKKTSIKAKDEIDYENKLENYLKEIAKKATEDVYKKNKNPSTIRGKIIRYDKAFTFYDGDINADGSINIKEEGCTEGFDDSEESYIGVGVPIKRKTIFDRIKELTNSFKLFYS